MACNFESARRDVDFKLCEEVAIRPLIDKLDFIEDKQRWGYKFRFGFFEITQADFEFIAWEMSAWVK
jgi:predicted RNA-binding protein